MTEWKPPSDRMRDGAVIFTAWQSIRAAIEAAYRVLGREVPRDGIPTDDWNLARLAIDAYRHQTRAQCIECLEPLWPHVTERLHRQQ